MPSKYTPNSEDYVVSPTGLNRLLNPRPSSDGMLPVTHEAPEQRAHDVRPHEVINPSPTPNVIARSNPRDVELK